MKVKAKHVQKSIRRIALMFFGTIVAFLMYSCEKEEPNPPIVPMYGVQAVEYEDVRISD
jgi:hypothetical protein